MEVIPGVLSLQCTKPVTSFSFLSSTALGFVAAKSFQTGAKLAGSLLGCAGVGSAVLCYSIAKKLGDYKTVWEEVDVKRNQYRLISTRLESLKAMVEAEMTAGVQLTRSRSWRRRFGCLFACRTQTK